MQNTRVCEILGIEKPIIQAPMLWLCDPELVAGVCEAGGLGTLGVNGGYKTQVSTVEATADRIRESIRAIKAKTDKPFAFNYMMPIAAIGDYNPFSEACLNVAIEEGVKVVVAVGDANEAKIKDLKSKGLTVIYRSLDPTIENAKIAEKAGADIIVATGFDEGGCTPSNPLGTFSIVPIIADAVNVPVLAAGGVVDYRGVNAAFALGAEGVFCGTLFIASKEGPAHDNVKEAIIKAESTDTITYPIGPPFARYLKGAKTEQLYDKFVNRIPVDAAELGDPFPLDGFMLGDLDKGPISTNAAVSLIKEIKSCKEIIDGLFPKW